MERVLPAPEAGRETPKGGVLVDVAASQASWFAVVLGAAWGHPWLGSVLALLPLVALFWRDGPSRASLRFVAEVTFVGAVFETFNVLASVYVPSSGLVSPWVAPPWMLVLWAGFAFNFRRGLAWLSGRPWLAALVGAVAGPVAFSGGARLGAILLSEAPIRIGLLSSGWALLLPVLSWRADAAFGRPR